MNIIKNKVLIGSDNKILKTVNDEIILTADKLRNIFVYEEYIKAIKSNMSVYVIRLYLLDENELPKIDISEYLLQGNLSYNYQNGQTHSLSMTLDNSNGFWVVNSNIPTKRTMIDKRTMIESEKNNDKDEKVSPVWELISSGTTQKEKLWRGTKFRLDIGLFSFGKVYWRQCGVFCLKDVGIEYGDEKTLSLQLYDKYSLLDGTIGGTINSDLTIPNGTPLDEAIKMCLLYEDDYGNIFDNKPILFEKDVSGIKTPYTIQKTGETTIGDVLIDLALIASCDILYNSEGNLLVRAGVDEESLENKPIAWYYNDNDLAMYSSPSISIDMGAMINKYIVKGAIENGQQYKGIKINDNPHSSSSVLYNPVNSRVLEDSNLNSNKLCEERANYELQKYLLDYVKHSFQSIFIPHINPKDVISWTNKELDLINEIFVIKSFSFSLENNNIMDMELSRICEMEMF